MSKPLLTDDEIFYASDGETHSEDSRFAFRKGARFARDFYEERLKVAIEALEFYAQKPVPDITSEFAKTAAEWGENVITWEPLTDMGTIAREALKALEEWENP